jgi:hypothetical protein
VTGESPHPISRMLDAAATTPRSRTAILRTCSEAIAGRKQSASVKNTSMSIFKKSNSRTNIPATLHREFGVHFRLLESTKELHQTPFGTIQQFLYCSCRVGWVLPREK